MDIKKHQKCNEDGHFQHKNTDKVQKKFGLKHGLLMILCCLIPIVIAGALPIIGFKNLSWTWILFLLCPLMHIGMMLFMKDHH